MLIFVDQQKNIKVIRADSADDGTVSRTRLGSIQKSRAEIPDELRSVLKEDEVKEVEDVIAAYEKAHHVQVHADLLKFPQTIREVYEFVSSGHADEIEKRLFISSLVETLRLIRKLDREPAI